MSNFSSVKTGDEVGYIFNNHEWGVQILPVIYVSDSEIFLSPTLVFNRITGVCTLDEHDRRLLTLEEVEAIKTREAEKDERNKIINALRNGKWENMPTVNLEWIYNIVKKDIA